MRWLRRALPIIGLGAVLAFAAWIWMSPRRSNAGAIARCREAYGARTRPPIRPASIGSSPCRRARAKWLRCPAVLCAMRSSSEALSNKRLKLSGGDRFKGSGVLCLGGHGLSSTTLAPASESPAA